MVALIGAGFAAALLAYALRARLPPFATGFLGLSVALIIVSRGPRSIIGTVLYNAGFACLALGLLEAYLAVFRPMPALVKQTFAPAVVPTERREGSYVSDFLADDLDLGYRIAPGAREITSVLKRDDGTAIYDVRYSIDGFGLRRTPGSSNAVGYFFGDSFTFGEGVDDDETLPAWFSRFSGFRAINFGVPGYGPHQMLRSLELDRPSSIGAAPPNVVIYTLLTGHIARAAGHSPWDEHGPLYEVVDGVARYAGPFRPKAADAPPSLAQRILTAWRTYRLVQQHFEQSALAAHAAYDRERVLAILTAARDLISHRYGVNLVIVLWDTIPSNYPPDADWFTAQLEARGIPVLRISKAVPALGDADFYLPVDGHPTGAAYRLAAQSLAAFVSAHIR